MSVWILNPAFTESEEATFIEHSELPLPFAGLPDLSGVESEFAMRALIAAVHPELPPESINRRAEIAWRNYHELALEDLVLVPYAQGRLAALAEVTERYRYYVQDGVDRHSASIRWLNTHIPRKKLAALSLLLANPVPMQLVDNGDQRKHVYRLLDRPYNRFVKWQWLLGVAIVAQVAVMLMGMFTGN